MKFLKTILNIKLFVSEYLMLYIMKSFWGEEL